MVSLFWGFRSRLAVMGRGVFDCPVCAKQQPFELRQLALWFTLFFVPIARTRPLGEHVYCLGCRNPLKRDVLDAGAGPGTAFMPALQGLAYDVPSSMTTFAQPAAAVTASAPTTSRATVDAPAAMPARTASRRAATASATASAAAVHPAVRSQIAPPQREAVYRVRQGAGLAARAAALRGNATPATAHESEERERPAFGQSAFAKATYARQRRPAPTYGPAAISEPAFFTPRR